MDLDDAAQEAAILLFRHTDHPYRVSRTYYDLRTRFRAASRKPRERQLTHDVLDVKPDFVELVEVRELADPFVKAVFLEGMSYREAAERFGVSHDTVRTRVSEGVARLKEVYGA